MGHHLRCATTYSLKKMISRWIPIALVVGVSTQTAAHGPGSKHSHQTLQHGSVLTRLSATPNAAKPETVVRSGSGTVINSQYVFENDITDEAGDYALTLEGEQSERYVDRDDGRAISLQGRTFLALPQQLNRDIQVGKSLSISVDFLFQDTGVDESARVIFSNKTWAYDVPGLKIEVLNEQEAWQPNQAIFVQFNLGMGIQEIANRFFGLRMDEWHTATVDLDFENNTVTFGVNGRTTTRSLTEDEGGGQVDTARFVAALQQNAFRIGAHQPDHSGETPWSNVYEVESGVGTTSSVADVLIDNVIIQSPRPDGDSSVVRSVLSAMTAHLRGQSPLSDLEMAAQRTLLNQNLSGADFSAFASEARAFVDAHAASFGPLYTVRFRNNLDNAEYDSFDDVSKAYVDLGVWMLKEGLTPDNALSAQGLQFVEHTQWPGELPSGAQRVSNGTADIRAQYVRDPGYLMGGMRQAPDSELAAYLYRPTGFYAPAGETVSVTVPQTWVDSGLHIRVGAHADNHQVLTSTSRFPVLSADFRIASTTVEVVNPFGGNIYVLVPQNLDLGWNQIRVAGAVRAPYFSSREGYETAEADWNSIRQYPGVFTDFESDKFMITVPTAQLQRFNQPRELLDRWDEIMDVLQTLHGRPMERSRAEAYLLDASQVVVGSFPGGYPVTPGLYAEGATGITDGYYSPFAALNIGTWEEDEGLSVMLHELGHHHFGRYVGVGEQEVYVNVPAAAVFNALYGLSFDDALKYSGYQKFSRTDAAIDWMVTHNFRNGNPMGFDPTTDFEPIETSYQARGHAKYLDLADIYGSWDALAKIYETYYLDDLASGTPPDTQIEVPHDDFLQRGSEALQCNLASLFHFWGVHPSDSLASELSRLPVCDGAAERIVHYLDNAPRTNEDLQQFHAEKTAVNENQLKFQIYDQLLPAFDIGYAQQIREVGTDILSTYFDMEKDTAPTAPAVRTTSFNVDQLRRSAVTFGWQPSVDAEGKALKYSWVLMREDTEEVLLSRSWVDGNSVTISWPEIRAALGDYLDDGVQPRLTQQVTTSDTFTVVQSAKTLTRFTALTDADNDGLSDDEEARLGTNPSARDSDSDGLSDGDEVNVFGTNPLSADTDGDGIRDGADNTPNGEATQPPVSRTTRFDYDGDGSADVAVRRASNSVQYILNSEGRTDTYPDGIQRIAFGRNAQDIPISGDFDGDGLTDVAVRRPGTQFWYVKNSSGVDKISGHSDGITRQRFGLRASDVPVIGDYDGDGLDDLAVFRPSTQFWYVRNSSGTDRMTGNGDGITRFRFGTSSDDIPVPADYDGDGVTDIAVRNPASKEWRIRNSSGIDHLSGRTDGITRRTFGSRQEDIPVRGDFDGDGKDDIAVRRPSTYYWYVLNSSGSNYNSDRGDGIQRVVFGRNASDIPIPADYDGDGITDIAVRRPSNYIQYILQSGDGEISRLTFGKRAGDVPLAAPIATKMAMTD